MTPVDQAYEILATGDVDRAVSTLVCSGEQGDADSWLELAVWYMRPVGVKRNLERARTCFRKAGELGNRQAQTIYTALLGIGVGGARNWAGALAALRSDIAKGDARQLIEMLDAMHLNHAGDPVFIPQPEILSQTPDVRLFPSLLTAGECRYIVQAAEARFARSEVVDPLSGRLIPHPVRTSDHASFGWVDENPVIHAINRRLAAASGTAWSWGEPLQILRYRAGQEYKAHHDAIMGAENQRVFTMLVYLNDNYTDGETLFLATGLKIKGAIGDALLFRNADSRGRPDPMAQHAGLPVTSGEKLIASRWIREREFAPLQ